MTQVNGDRPIGVGPAATGNGQVAPPAADLTALRILGAVHQKVAYDIGDVTERRLLRVGLLLHVAVTMTDREQGQGQMLSALDELDGAIKDLRRATLDLYDGLNLLPR